MLIEEEAYKIFQEIVETQKNIEDSYGDSDKVSFYIDKLVILKRKLQLLEKDSYLKRNPDCVGTDIDLYVRNIHDLNNSDADTITYDITLHNTKEKIGYMDVRLKLLKSEEYLGNIGTNIDPLYKGKRYSKQAFSLARDMMLEKGLKKPIFTVNINNISSIKSLENMNATKIGSGSIEDEEYYIYEIDLEEENNVK